MIFQLLAAMLPALTSSGATAAGTAAAAPAALGTAATAAAPAMASAAAPAMAAAAPAAAAAPQTLLGGLQSAVFGGGAAGASGAAGAPLNILPASVPNAMTPAAGAPAAAGMWDTLKGMIGKDGSVRQGMGAINEGMGVAKAAGLGGGGVQPSPIAPSSGVQMGNNQIVRPDVAQRPDMLRARMAQRNPLEFLLNNRG